MRITAYLCDGCRKDIERSIPMHSATLQDKVGRRHEFHYCTVSCAALHISAFIVDAEDAKP